MSVYSPKKQSEIKLTFTLKHASSCNDASEPVNKHYVHMYYIGILFPKLFWPTVWKNCSNDREKKLLKLKAEGWEFADLWDH